MYKESVANQVYERIVNSHYKELCQLADNLSK
ncbi:MAG: hypothetical protein ACRCTY_03015 [Candidatus Adiutrix sp.]